MKLEKYGICLEKLTHDKIELVRRWRNHPKIRRYMEFREEITPEMQEKWFEKINTSGKDFFFIINYEDKDIGLINVRDVDFDKKIGEPGIFIWDDDYLNSDVSYRASLCLLDWFFEDLGMRMSIAHILRDNKRSIQFAKIRGYKLSDDQDDVYNQVYTLYKEDYEKNKVKLLKIFK